MKNTLVSKTSKIIVNTAILLWSIALTAVIIEFVTRYYLKADQKYEYTNKDEFRIARPLPYKDSNYDVVEFYKISEDSTLRWETPKKTKLVIPQDYKSKYINVENNLRKTTNQPENYVNVVYLFGGSTVFCSEVPDDYTITSYLQRYLNDKYENKYKVENYGATSVVAFQEVERLKTIQLKKGDVVIFFDGANEILQSIYNNDPNGWVVDNNRKILQNNKLFGILFKIHSKLRKKSEFVNHFLSPFEKREIPKHLYDSSIQNQVNKMSNNYLESIKEASDYTVSNGGSFYHFLQPTIFSTTKRSEYENKLESNPYIVEVGLKKSFELGYGELKSSVVMLQSEGINSFDMTSLFNEKDGKEFFLDWVHVAEVGNEKIAKEIFNQVFQY